jgi:hypothetical protein
MGRQKARYLLKYLTTFLDQRYCFLENVTGIH